MQVVFLEARAPLTKKYTATTKEPYPNAFEFKSHHHTVKKLSELYPLLVSHAKVGHCLLKGELDRPLNWESRAGHTNPNQFTHWLCLDIDGITSVRTVDEFMSRNGMTDVSYILQWSASYGVHGNTTMRAHVFVLLKSPAAPAALKLWLKQLNLTLYTQDLALTKTHVALRWGLDITTCQNDKLIYITAPDCDPPSLDTFTGQRIQLITKSVEFFDFNTVTLQTAEQIKALEESEINRLRKTHNMPERKASQFKLKEHKGEHYLPNPDEATVTSTKEERGFIYLNLNGGDSWGYYHPVDNPTFIYNFKGEPTYKTSELVPDYWQSLQQTKKQQVRATNNTKLFLAFRDFRTAEYYNGWYDQATDELVLHQAKSETQLADFLDNYGQPVPAAVPIWNIVYDPAKPTLDLVTRTVNVFKPSKYMRFAEQYYKIATAKPTPTIDRVIKSVVGASNYDHWFNWFAYIFQSRTATCTAWVWQGLQGTGKGVLINHIIVKLLGRENVAIKRMEELEDKFNGYLENILLCYVDEAQIADSGRSRMIVANLKNQITEPTISIRQMRQSSYEVPNRVSWIFGSNMPDPVVIESSDRRYNVGDYQDQRLTITSADIAAIETELDSFALRLRQHTVDLDLVRTPKYTEAKEQMIMVSRNSADTVADAIKHGRLDRLWEALPTVDQSLMKVEAAIRLEPYKRLLEELVTSRRDRLTREELFIIFDYNVGNVPSSPWKLTSYLKHHGLQIKDIRLHDKTTKGVMAQWANSDEWFEAAKAEIAAAKAPKLKVVPAQPAQPQVAP